MKRIKLRKPMYRWFYSYALTTLRMVNLKTTNPTPFEAVGFVII